MRLSFALLLCRFLPVSVKDSSAVLVCYEVLVRETRFCSFLEMAKGRRPFVCGTLTCDANAVPIWIVFLASVVGVAGNCPPTRSPYVFISHALLRVLTFFLRVFFFFFSSSFRKKRATWLILPVAYACLKD